MTFNRIDDLVAHLAGKPIALLRLDEAEWAAVSASRRGIEEFTFAIPHDAFASLRAPTMCLLIAASDRGPRVMAGVIGRPSAVTTIQSRVKIKRVFQIAPVTPDALVAQLDNPVHMTALRVRLADVGQLTMLSPKLSGHLVERLALIDENRIALRSIAASLSAPRRVRGNAALQEQSLRTALRAFGLAPEAIADEVELLSEDETAISRVALQADEENFVDQDDLRISHTVHAIEDGFVEHDARWVRGLDLVGSDATGRAIYSRGDERLEVITANRRPLEAALGVDLIYINTVQQNVVMVQHKMLEASGNRWLYRPDDQLAKEIARMEAFVGRAVPGDTEYRLHAGMFYLKFVKRDAAIRQGGILMPLDHYLRFLTMPASRGARGGLRIDYDGLGGRYMREQPFVDLIRAGYIGTYADDTAALRTIIQAILDDGGAVVTAIQSERRRRDIR